MCFKNRASGQPANLNNEWFPWGAASGPAEARLAGNWPLSYRKEAAVSAGPSLTRPAATRPASASLNHVQTESNGLESNGAVEQSGVSAQAAASAARQPVPMQIDWLRVIPYLGLHVAAISVIWVGASFAAAVVTLGMIALRVFALTAFYHRYFSHRAFKTSRWFQFVGAVLGASSAQRGPIWWAAHHRAHHKFSDQPEDFHSPRQRGFWFSHMGWFLTREAYATNKRLVRDWLKFPELRFLDRFDFLVPLLLAVGMYGLGELLRVMWPASGTSGWQMLVWGFLISTLCVYHITYLVNSLAHVVGRRRFQTTDDSRNSLWIALLTFGEGWHNNHHRYMASARQGFYWWEIDITFYILRALSWVGIVWDLKPVPPSVLEEGRQGDKSHGSLPAA